MGLFSKIWKAVTKPFKKIISWLVPSPDLPEAQAVTVEKQGSDHPIPIVYGTRRIGGIKVHKYVTDAAGGAKNEFLHLIIVFCEGPIQAITELFFDGVSETDSRWNKSGGGKWFTVQRCLGADDQAALSTGIPNWTSEHRLRGLAYIHLRLQMDESQSIWRGEPEVTALIQGRKIFDPRTNTTAYSENLPLQLLDYLTNTRYGKGMPSGRLPVASFISSANWADDLITSTVTLNDVTSSVTHARITGNLVIDTGRPVFSNVKQLLSGMRGLLPVGSGIMRLDCEREGAPVFFFGHHKSTALNYANITGPVKSRSGRKNERYNRVIVRFPNKATSYERDEVCFPAATDPLFAQWLAEDNGVLLEQSFEFDTITNKAEAYQMAEIVAKRSRSRTECSFSASPLAILCEPGDIVGVTDDTRGWDAKPFRIEQVKLREDADVELELVEHQDAIYPWSGVAYSERTLGTNLGDPTAISAPTALAITPDLTYATGGFVTWSAENDAFIRHYRIQLWRDDVKVLEQTTPERRLTLPLLSVGSYVVKVFAVSTLSTLSPAALYSFSVAVPVPPQSVVIESTNFSLTIIPQLAGIGLGTEFEFAILSTSNWRGRGASYVISDLLPDTEYTVYVRTVSALGQSNWVSAVGKTENDPQPLLDFLGEALLEQLGPDLVEQTAGQVNQYVNDRLSDMPTNGQMAEYFDSQINEALSENPYPDIAEMINGIIDNYETEKQVESETEQRQADIQLLNVAVQEESSTRASQIANVLEVVATESETRATAITQLTSQIADEGQTRTAAISQLSQTIADETSARALQVNELTSRVETEETTRASAISQLNQTIADESGTRSTQITELNSRVETEEITRAAAIQQVNQSVADESSARAAQINSLTSRISNEEITRASAVQQLDQAITDEAGTRAYQYGQLSSSISTETLNRVVAISQLNQTIATESSLRSTQYTELTASDAAMAQQLVEVQSDINGVSSSVTTLAGTVNNATTGLSATWTLANQAKSTADGAVSSVAALGTRVTSTENGLSSANLQLTSHGNSLGQLFSRAFLGVQTTSGGITTINGIVIDGATNNIDFRAGSIRFTSDSGVTQFYWNASLGKFSFVNGHLSAASIEAPNISGGNIIGAVVRAGYLISGEEASSGYVRIIGPAFGTNGKLIDWYGPKHWSWFNYEYNQVNVAALNLINPLDAKFFIANDGSQSRFAENKMASVPTSFTGSRGAWTTLATLTHQAVAGYCEVSFSSDIWAGTIRSNAPLSGCTVQLRIIDGSNNVIASKSMTMVLSNEAGTDHWDVSAPPNSSGFILGGIADNRAKTKYSNQNYQLQILFNFTGPYTSLSLSTTSTSLFKSLEVTV